MSVTWPSLHCPTAPSPIPHPTCPPSPSFTLAPAFTPFPDALCPVFALYHTVLFPLSSFSSFSSCCPILLFVWAVPFSLRLSCLFIRYLSLLSHCSHSPVSLSFCYLFFPSLFCIRCTCCSLCNWCPGCFCMLLPFLSVHLLSRASVSTLYSFLTFLFLCVFVPL